MIKRMKDELVILETNKDILEQQMRKLQSDYDHLDIRYNTNIKEV